MVEEGPLVSPQIVSLSHDVKLHFSAKLKVRTSCPCCTWVTVQSRNGVKRSCWQWASVCLNPLTERAMCAWDVPRAGLWYGHPGVRSPL